MAPGGEGVFHLGGDDGVGGALDDAVVLELAELLGEHLLGDGGDGAFQIGEAADAAAEELEEDEELPAAFEHAEGLLDALGGGEAGPGFAAGGGGGRGAYFFVRTSHMGGMRL